MPQEDDDDEGDEEVKLDDGSGDHGAEEEKVEGNIELFVADELSMEENDDFVTGVKLVVAVEEAE
jgi:hypothetical protein